MSVGHGRSSLASIPLSNYTAAWTIRCCFRPAHAKCWISGSARRRTPRATSGSARMPHSTSESARASASDVAAARGGAFGDWCATPHGALARVVLLDQFTRNLYRDTPRAFAGDAGALATANEAVDAEASTASWTASSAGSSTCRSSIPRTWPMQERSLALFRALVRGNR